MRRESRSLTDLHHGLEQLRRQSDAAGLEAVIEFGADAGCTKPAEHAARFRNAGFFEQENVLQGDDVLLHSHDFGNMRDAAGAVASTRDPPEGGYGGRRLRSGGADENRKTA